MAVFVYAARRSTPAPSGASTRADIRLDAVHCRFNVSVPAVFTFGGMHPDPNCSVYGPDIREPWICNVPVAVWVQFWNGEG